MAKVKKKVSKLKTTDAEKSKDELKKVKAKLAQLKKKYIKLSTENDDAKDKHVRLLAEFDNYRRRTLSEKEKLINYDGERIIKSLLSSFDDLERTISDNYEDSKSILDGIEIIIKNIKKVLSDNEIENFSSIGERFNPELHEALMSEPGKDENIILKEFEKGYKYKDKIIRHAKVVVSTKS